MINRKGGKLKGSNFLQGFIGCFARLKWEIFIAVALLFAFWQVVLYQDIMKWDIMDISLPWRYFVSECINNGKMPLWNPYINLGFPQMGDARTWYPVAWGLSLFFGYSVKILQLDFLLHVLIGGFGFFKLSKSKNLTIEIAFILSVGYMLSGFFIGNAQHMGWVRSGAWLPFIFLYYEQFSRSLKIKDGFLLAIVLFFLLSGGYEAYFITVGYTLAIISLVKIWKNFAAVKERSLWSYHSILMTLIFFLGLSGIVLHSTFELSQYITRGKPLDFSNEGWGVLTGSLTPKSLISFVLPFGTTTDSTYWGNDISMINSYMGIIPFSFALYGLIRPKKKALPYLVVGLFFLAVALAEVFPFRKWLYLYLPYMDIFRFSTLFRLYAIMFLLLGAGMSLQDFFLERTFKKMVGFFCIWGGLLVVALLFFLGNWWIGSNESFALLASFSFQDFLVEATVNHRLLLNAAFVLVLLGLIYYVILNFSGRKMIWALCFITVLDLVVVTQLNIYSTVIDGKVSPAMVDKSLKEMPKGFPLPSLQHSMKEFNIEGEKLPYLWKNLGVFYKSPNLDGYTPYTLNSFQKAYDHNLVEQIANKPLLFLTHVVSAENKLLLDSAQNGSFANSSIEVKQFGPNEIMCIAEAEKDCYLVFAQCNYPHWYAFVNYVKAEKQVVNESFMAVKLPKGRHEVKFVFAPFYTNKLFVLSWLTLLVGVVVITVSRLRYGN